MNGNEPVRIGRRTIPASRTEGPSDTQPAIPRQHESREYRLKLATPMFGGGARAGQVDPAWPIRASGIRGQLRYWWRLLHQHQFLENGMLNVARMRARETEIWGSAELPGAVRLRTKLDSQGSVQFRNGQDFGFQQLSPESYALFSAIASTDVSRIVKEELTFNLYVEWPSIDELNRQRAAENRQRRRKGRSELPSEIQDFSQEIDGTIAAWVAFGGVGARTRRGLGSLQIIEPSDQAPQLRLPAGSRLYLSPRHESNAAAAWRKAVEVYQKFRQSFRGQKHRKQRLGGGHIETPGRTHWPEPDSIRMLTNCALDDGTKPNINIPVDINTHQHSEPIVNQAVPNFPRAVLGLPIEFHFAADGPGKGKPADPNRDPATVQLVPHATRDDGSLAYRPRGAAGWTPIAGDRMASPVITKALLLREKWYAAVLILPHQHALRVNAVIRGENALWNQTTEAAEKLLQEIPNSQITGHHLGSLCPDTMTDPMRGHTNAIDALIVFLEQKEDGASPPVAKTPFVEGTLP